jgi:hypothetical protein
MIATDQSREVAKIERHDVIKADEGMKNNRFLCCTIHHLFFKFFFVVVMVVSILALLIMCLFSTQISQTEQNKNRRTSSI